MKEMMRANNYQKETSKDSFTKIKINSLFHISIISYKMNLPKKLKSIKLIKERKGMPLLSHLTLKIVISTSNQWILKLKKEFKNLILKTTLLKLL